MEAIHLVPEPSTTDLATLSDADLETFFAANGLSAAVVDRCDDSVCMVCAVPVPARAA